MDRNQQKIAKITDFLKYQSCLSPALFKSFQRSRLKSKNSTHEKNSDKKLFAFSSLKWKPVRPKMIKTAQTEDKSSYSNSNIFKYTSYISSINNSNDKFLLVDSNLVFLTEVDFLVSNVFRLNSQKNKQKGFLMKFKPTFLQKFRLRFFHQGFTRQTFIQFFIYRILLLCS